MHSARSASGLGGVTGTHGMRKGHDSSRGAPENEAEDHSEPQWMQGARRALWGQQDPRTPEWEAETGVHGLTGVVLEVPGCTKCTVATGGYAGESCVPTPGYGRSFWSG